MSVSDDDQLEPLRELLSGKKLPPVDSWHPEHTRDIDMRIARNGDWFYHGSRIQRQRMVNLFSTVLRCDEDGETYLVTPQERLRITVEDAPFTAVLLHKEGEDDKQGLVFTTNTGDKVLAGKQHPIVVEYHQPNGEPSPYVLVRGRLRALISRSVLIELAQLAVEINPHAAQEVQSREHDSKQDDQQHGQQFGIYSDGYFMPLAMQ